MESCIGMNQNNLTVLPKLRKHRKIDSRWGLKYYTALKNAIFTKQFTAYTPPNLPPSLRKETTQPESLYTCKECNDCFRFQVSYEEHISRRSWILGYWCQQCVINVCTHSKPGSSPCTACEKQEKDKRFRGSQKTPKSGLPKIFYNQCQFFTHLRNHGISMVDMTDLMLMPIPTNIIGMEWISDFDVACEALVGHAFLSKIHVLDWLKAHDAQTNWWILDANDEVSKIIRNYKGRASHSRSLISGFSPEKEVNKSLELSRKKSKASTEEIKEEYEDNPCIPNDIAFIDCGPAPQGLVPELSVYSTVRKHTTLLVKPKQFCNAKHQAVNVLQSKRKKVNRILSKCASPDMPISYGNTTITPRVTCNDLKTEQSPAKMITDIKMEPVEQTEDSSDDGMQYGSPNRSKSPKRHSTQVTKRKNIPILPANQKVLTVQHSKNVDLTTIINHITPQLGTNKRIVFIGQDTEGPAVTRKQDSRKKIIHVLPDVSISKKTKNVRSKMVPVTKMENVTNDDKDARNVSSNPSSPRAQNAPLTATKVIYQNGRKYIIKQSSSPINRGPRRIIKQTGSEKNRATTSAKSQQPENVTSPGNVSVAREDISPLTPSPSPSELSSSSSCDVQTKQALPALKNEPQTCTPRSNDNSILDQYENLSFCKGSDENLYLSVTPLKRSSNHPLSDTLAMIAKCKQEMLNEFFHLPYPELKKRVEHLQDLDSEITSLLKCVAENVVKEKLKAVHILQHVLKHCMENHSKKQYQVNADNTLESWEAEYKTQMLKLSCSVCEKALKPECYIPGFSKPAKDEEYYCSCYKQVCHKCEMYQGNSTRFIAHHHFHCKVKPYLCPDCFQRFRSFKLLEVHTWSVCFHTLKKRVFRCKICEIDGFGDIESITRHFAIMHSNTKIVCNVCHMVLPSLSEYQHHMKLQHRTEKCTEPIRVVLCKLGQCIVRCENFMLHMEKHVLEQKLVLWFRCPFCPFVDLEAKRLMPHLQTKHLHRLTEIISRDALIELLPKDLVKAAFGANSRASTVDLPTEFINEEPSEDGTLLPKIINTCTITSEVFERGAQEVVAVGAESTDKSADKTNEKEHNDSATWVTQTDEISPKIGNISSGSHIVYMTQESNKPDALPKILEVRSIADAGSQNLQSTSKSLTTTLNNESITIDTINVEPKRKADLEEPDKPVNDGFARPNPILQSDETIKLDGITIGSSVTVKVTSGPTKSSANKSQTAPISKPPPLARIPQHILQANTVTSLRVPQPKSVREKALAESLRNFEITSQPLQRIALNGPSTPTDEHLEFTCHLCGEMISTRWLVLNSHYKKYHSEVLELVAVNPTLERITADFIRDGYKELLNDKKRKTDIAAVPPKRRRRWNSKKIPAEGRNTNSPSLGLCVQQETAEDGDGNIICKKCNLRCTDMTNLREHIAESHRIKGRYLICLECGDNFVVAPSLQMHLKAFHGIQDPITYMSKNTLYAPDDFDDSDEESKTIEGNQCHVCMAVFENKAAVDKHLRVHGMAFLNRRMNEARNARKSPEQLQTSEDSKEKPPKEASKEPTTEEKPPMSLLDKISATI